MTDQDKTKEQLMDEVALLRRRLAEAEARGKTAPKRPADASRRCAERAEMDTHIEFIADFDLIEAKTINLSEGGICFEVAAPLPFEMRFEAGGRTHEHRAHLIWMMRLPQGGCRFGCQFTPREEEAKG